MLGCPGGGDLSLLGARLFCLGVVRRVGVVSLVVPVDSAELCLSRLLVAAVLHEARLLRDDGLLKNCTQLQILY